MFFNILMILMAISAFLGILFCHKKGSEIKYSKPIIGLLFIVLIISSYVFYSNLINGNEGSQIEDEKRYIKAKYFVLGNELAKKLPEAKVLFIIGDKNEATGQSESYDHKLLMEHLVEGFGDKIKDTKIITTPHYEIMKTVIEDHNNAYSYITENEKFWSAKQFNDIITQNNDRDLIITFVELPLDKRKIKIWKDYERKPKDTPKLVFFPEKSEISTFAPFLHNGLIPALVINKSNIMKTTTPASLSDCFELRYDLITKENLKDFLGQ